MWVIKYLVCIYNTALYIYIYEMGSSYTFFKPLDLNKSNGKKKTLINTNILIDFFYYPLFNTFHTYF